jgi:hypothetical protein
VCSQNVSLTGNTSNKGILISKVKISLWLAEATNATARIAKSQMWISDDVYNPYTDSAVCFCMLKLFAVPLLGTLRWDRAIHNMIKCYSETISAIFWDLTLRRNPKIERISFNLYKAYWLRDAPTV